VGEVLLACAQGRLHPGSIRTSPDVAVCVVLAAEGYPESPRRGDAILGIDDAIETEAYVFHAGTALRDGRLVTDGGRVLSVVATGMDLREATERAYAAADRIEFPGAQLRRDIALTPALVPA
jgi:phosphoribosylamine---glycine ligase